MVCPLQLALFHSLCRLRTPPTRRRWRLRQRASRWQLRIHHPLPSLAVLSPTLRIRLRQVKRSISKQLSLILAEACRAELLILKFTTPPGREFFNSIFKTKLSPPGCNKLIVLFGLLRRPAHIHLKWESSAAIGWRLTSGHQ